MVLARGDASPEERARIETLADRARQHYGDARKTLELASGGKLPPQVEAARKAALAAAEEGFKLADDNIVQAATLSMPSTQWVAQMTSQWRYHYRHGSAGRGGAGQSLRHAGSRSVDPRRLLPFRWSTLVETRGL
ncbi:hypothetical protein QUF31_21470 [Dickeya chrysanthemi]|uniref:hypothetical protein n=1 Tax=Dickeya chrysanthemi TaxID=556 RepID=UPI0025A0E6E6|nr:hypothetical protein [Dickeya chrysanthemi]WJM85524.1 hypothetical protein QUF31_21470 [Dickeya chrysanthemi]